MQLAAFIVLSAMCLPISANERCTVIGCDEKVEPKPVKYVKPVYPRTEALRNSGGMVEVEYMVSKQGTVFAPVVTQSTSDYFERSAIQAVSKYQLDPAKVDGEPVESRRSIRIMFSMEGAKEAVSHGFAGYYRKAMKELEKPEPDFKRVDQLINRMQSREHLSFYALARLNFVKLRSALANGTVAEQIDAIKVALSFEAKIDKEKRAIDHALKLKFYQKLFNLHYNKQQFFEAQEAFYFLQSYRAAPELVSTYENLLVKADQVRLKKGTSIQTPLVFGDRGFVLESMFMRTFSFANVDGTINGLKLRCSRKYKELAFSPEAEYRIPVSWGHCKIQIDGDKGASATLFQYET